MTNVMDRQPLHPSALVVLHYAMGDLINAKPRVRGEHCYAVPGTEASAPQSSRWPHKPFTSTICLADDTA